LNAVTSVLKVTEKLCLNKPHMEEQDLLNLTLSGCFLGSSYCCQKLQKGDMHIFFREDHSFKK